MSCGSHSIRSLEVGKIALPRIRRESLRGRLVFACEGTVRNGQSAKLHGNLVDCR